MIQNNFYTFIVDDDDSVIFLHEIILGEAGYHNIHAFINAQEAFDHLQNHQNDMEVALIFLDINMPIMSGWDLLDAIKEKGHSIPLYVVMVTSSINSEDRIKARHYKEIIDFVEKPLTIETALQIKEKFKIQ